MKPGFAASGAKWRGSVVIRPDSSSVSLASFALEADLMSRVTGGPLVFFRHKIRFPLGLTGRSDYLAPIGLF